MAVIWIDEGEDGSLDTTVWVGITCTNNNPVDELYRLKPMDVSSSDVIVRKNYASLNNHENRSWCYRFGCVRPVVLP